MTTQLFYVITVRHLSDYPSEGAKLLGAHCSPKCCLSERSKMWSAWEIVSFRCAIMIRVIRILRTVSFAIDSLRASK